METANQTISEETVPALQLERKLLPIEEYAAREGVPIGIVEEFRKIGIANRQNRPGQENFRIHPKGNPQRIRPVNQ